MKKWAISKVDKEKVKMISAKYGIPVFTALLLVIRNITEKDDIERFFSADSSLSDPFNIKDMDRAVERIKKAVTSGEKICIYGDYD